MYRYGFNPKFLKALRENREDIYRCNWCSFSMREMFDDEEFLKSYFLDSKVLLQQFNLYDHIQQGISNVDHIDFPKIQAITRWLSSDLYTDIKYKDNKFRVPSMVLDFTEALPDDLTWSETLNNTISFDYRVINESIRVRYAMYDRPRNGLMNIVIDNYVPKILYTSEFDLNKLSLLNIPKTAYAISPWFAELLGVRHIETEQLCRVLGYDVKALKTLVSKVKARDLTITFLGYGGTNVNTIHWLTEIMKIVGSTNLFKQINIIEPELVEVSNLLRFPKNPAITSSSIMNAQVNQDLDVNEANLARNGSKLKLLTRTEIQALSRNKPFMYTNMITQSFPHGMNGLVYDYEKRMNVSRASHIIYGAPTIATRDLMSKVGHFIAATHSGNTCSLYLNPKQDTDLQVESYGLISLTQFFMNQLRMAIAFLEVITNSEIDLNEEDKDLFSFSFEGNVVLPTDKTYNFQLDTHSGLVSTEAEAQTQF